MHADEVDTDISLVGRLVVAQFPVGWQAEGAERVSAAIDAPFPVARCSFVGG